MMSWILSGIGRWLLSLPQHFLAAYGLPGVVALAGGGMLAYKVMQKTKKPLMAAALMAFVALAAMWFWPGRLLSHAATGAAHKTVAKHKAKPKSKLIRPVRQAAGHGPGGQPPNTVRPQPGTGGVRVPGIPLGALGLSPAGGAAPPHRQKNTRARSSVSHSSAQAPLATRQNHSATAGSSAPQSGSAVMGTHTPTAGQSGVSGGSHSEPATQTPEQSAPGGLTGQQIPPVARPPHPGPKLPPMTPQLPHRPRINHGGHPMMPMMPHPGGMGGHHMGGHHGGHR